MRTIGLIEGMDWHSSQDYREIINQTVRAERGDLHSAEIVGWSVNFQRIRELQQAGDWKGAAKDLSDKAMRLEQAGAECVAICTNTMHIVAEEVQNSISIPLINIIDETAKRIKDLGRDKVGLLGTCMTMEKDFYRDRMGEHGIEILIPEAPERKIINHAIFEGVCKDSLTESERQTYRDSVRYLAGIGAQAVIYGCTEIRQILDPEESALPVHDSTRIHSEALVDFALR